MQMACSYIAGPRASSPRIPPLFTVVLHVRIKFFSRRGHSLKLFTVLAYISVGKLAKHAAYNAAVTSDTILFSGLWISPKGVKLGERIANESSKQRNVHKAPFHDAIIFVTSVSGNDDKLFCIFSYLYFCYLHFPAITRHIIVVWHI